MSNHTNTQLSEAPERIYMDLLSAEIQAERATKQEIEYVRADLVAHALAAPQEDASEFVNEFTNATIEAHVGFQHEKPFHDCDYDVCVKRRAIINASSPVSPSQKVEDAQDDGGVERWRRDLIAAGWTEESATAWYAPDGGLYRGPYGAWKELQRRTGTPVPSKVEEVAAGDLPFDDYCAGKDCRACNGVNCTCPCHANAASAKLLDVAHQCESGTYRPYPSALCSMCRAAKREALSIRDLCTELNRAATPVTPSDDQPLYTQGNREAAIRLLRQLRETADPEEIQRQKDSWAQLEAAFSPGPPSDAARKAAAEIWQSQCCVHTAHPPLGKKRLEGIISRYLPVVVEEGDERQLLPIEDMERDHFRDHPPEED